MPDLNPQDCHYYEPNKKDFIECPAAKGAELTLSDRSACKKCHHYKEILKIWDALEGAPEKE